MTGLSYLVSSSSIHVSTCQDFLPFEGCIGLPRWLSSKESACNAGDLRDVGLIPRSGRSPGGGHGDPLQYSCLDNPMDRGAWRATVHRVAKSRTRLKWLSTHTCKGCIIFHCVCIPEPHFICSSLNGHLGCCHILIIVSNAGMNIGVQISLSPCFQFFWVCAQKLELLDHMVILGLIFFRNCHTDSSYTILHSCQQQCPGVPISAHSLQHSMFFLSSFFFF